MSRISENRSMPGEADFDPLNLLPCDHYEYEFKNCTSFTGRLYNYYRGENQECQPYQDLFVDCLKYKRDPEKNFDLLLKLKKYENELVQKRVESVVKNDVWQLRQKPPSDWNSPLPDWCIERLKDTYWYKSRNLKQENPGLQEKN